MALIPFDMAWASNAVARTEQAMNTLERILSETSARLPGTGTSDVYSGATRAVRAAKEKLQIEVYNQMYRTEHDERARD